MYNGSIIRADPAKINKERRRKIRISMVMDEMEGRINKMSTRGRARPAEHDLDYQSVYVLYRYICQNK
jgi:hypothetical protein